MQLQLPRPWSCIYNAPVFAPWLSGMFVLGKLVWQGLTQGGMPLFFLEFRLLLLGRLMLALACMQLLSLLLVGKMSLLVRLDL